jgi:hypothetical protein
MGRQNANGPTLMTCLNDVYMALPERLVIPQLTDYAVLNEIERCLANGQMAGKGMMMDSLHIVALTWADLFITDDKKLQQIAERGGRAIQESAGKTRGPIVVDYRRPDQLAKIPTLGADPHPGPG